jgi:hypothetical protein
MITSYVRQLQPAPTPGHHLLSFRKMISVVSTTWFPPFSHARSDDFSGTVAMNNCMLLSSTSFTQVQQRTEGSKIMHKVKKKLLNSTRYVFLVVIR